MFVRTHQFSCGGCGLLNIWRKPPWGVSVIRSTNVKQQGRFIYYLFTWYLNPVGLCHTFTARSNKYSSQTSPFFHLEKNGRYALAILGCQMHDMWDRHEQNHYVKPLCVWNLCNIISLRLVPPYITLSPSYLCALDIPYCMRVLKAKGGSTLRIRYSKSFYNSGKSFSTYTI